MAVDASTFKSFLTEFSGLSDDTINIYLNQAAFRVNVTQLGVYYDQALMYMTAHMLTINNQGGNAAGGVRAESVGSLSKQYGGASLTSKTNLDTTTYGREYLNLLRLCCRGGYAVQSQACARN